MAWLYDPGCFAAAMATSSVSCSGGTYAPTNLARVSSAGVGRYENAALYQLLPELLTMYRASLRISSWKRVRTQPFDKVVARQPPPLRQTAKFGFACSPGTPPSASSFRSSGKTNPSRPTPVHTVARTIASVASLADICARV